MSDISEAAWRAASAALRTIVGGLTADIATARETNARLNRRAQEAEAAARQNVEECRRQGVPMGRVLLRWYAGQLQELAKAQAEAARLRVICQEFAADEHPSECDCEFCRPEDA